MSWGRGGQGRGACSRAAREVWPQVMVKAVAHFEACGRGVADNGNGFGYRLSVELRKRVDLMAA